MRPAGNMPGCLSSCSSPVWAMPGPAGGHVEVPPKAASVLRVLAASMAGRRSGDPDLGAVLLSQGEGLTHCIHAELPPILCLVCGGVQDTEVERGEEPHILAGEDADVSLPSPSEPRGDRAHSGHTPEERRAGSCSTSPLLPWAELEERESVSPAPLPCHHPLQGTVPMGLRDSQGPALLQGVQWLLCSSCGLSISPCNLEPLGWPRAL